MHEIFGARVSSVAGLSVSVSICLSALNLLLHTLNVSQRSYRHLLWSWRMFDHTFSCDLCERFGTLDVHTWDDQCVHRDSPRVGFVTMPIRVLHV